jgi:hypothetical protein
VIPYKAKKGVSKRTKARAWANRLRAGRPSFIRERMSEPSFSRLVFDPMYRGVVGKAIGSGTPNISDMKNAIEEAIKRGAKPEEMCIRARNIADFRGVCRRSEFFGAYVTDESACKGLWAPQEGDVSVLGIPVQFERWIRAGRIYLQMFRLPQAKEVRELLIGMKVPTEFGPELPDPVYCADEAEANSKLTEWLKS